MTNKKPTPWFGPKRFGFGIRPIAWQGWAVTFGVPVLVLLIFSYFSGNMF